MKNIIIILLILIGFNVSAQLTPIPNFRVQNASTEFGIPVPKNTTIYDDNTGNWYRATAGIASTATITTASGSLQSVSSSEVNDLSSVVTWTTIPDAYISESSVTQHETALTITESQISDLTHFTNADETDQVWVSDSVTYASKAYVNNQGFLTSYTETDPVFLAWDKDYNYLINTPDLSVYWKSDGTSTATGDWDLGAYKLSVSSISAIAPSSIFSSEPTLKIGGAFANQVNSGTIRFLEANNTGYQGTYIKYDGSTNQFHFGTNNLSELDDSNDIDFMYVDRGSTIVNFTGSIIATSFIKSGGTGNTILLDDGSTLPTSTYLTSYTETDPIFTAWDKSTGITIAASQVTDFDTEVSNNTDVTANTAKVESEKGNTPSTATTYTEQWSEGDVIVLPQLTGNTTLNIQNIPLYKTSQIRVVQNASTAYDLILNLYSDSGSTLLNEIPFGGNDVIDATTGNVTKIIYQRFGTDADVSYIYEN